jgi:hypothetical protein
MVESYERTFGVTPKGFSSPLEKNDHPELDSSEELGTGEIALFQSHRMSPMVCNFGPISHCNCRHDNVPLPGFST